MLIPGLVQFGLGRLRLELKERIDACSKHLRGLDMHEILRVATGYAIGGQREFTDLPHSGDAPPHAFGVATTVDSSLLKVDGLNPQNEPHQRAYRGDGLSCLGGYGCRERDNIRQPCNARVESNSGSELPDRRQQGLKFRE